MKRFIRKGVVVAVAVSLSAFPAGSAHAQTLSGTVVVVHPLAGGCSFAPTCLTFQLSGCAAQSPAPVEIDASIRDGAALAGRTATLNWNYTKPAALGSDNMRLQFYSSSCANLGTATRARGTTSVAIPSGTKWVALVPVGMGANATWSLRI